MPPTVPVMTADGPLAGPVADAVRSLAERTQLVDGAAALSERTVLGLDAADRHHALAYASGRLVGYAQVWPEGASELVVLPTERRRGIGTSLWTASTDAGATSVWAHGAMPPAKAFAAAHGLVVVRKLHRMERAVRPAEAITDRLPEPYTVRRFVVGSDEDAWLDANSAAFAEHPEQGGMTKAELLAKEAAPWFDPAGLLLVETPELPGKIAAFHWTKRVGSEGEVHAVGIRPELQGRGLAGVLTRLGMGYLVATGVDRIVLWVDSGNERALRTYEREGFRVSATDVVYGAPG